jgi:hypothetical protein
MSDMDFFQRIVRAFCLWVAQRANFNNTPPESVIDQASQYEKYINEGKKEA